MAQRPSGYMRSMNEDGAGMPTEMVVFRQLNRGSHSGAGDYTSGLHMSSYIPPFRVMSGTQELQRVFNAR